MRNKRNQACEKNNCGKLSSKLATFMLVSLLMDSGRIYNALIHFLAPQIGKILRWMYSTPNKIANKPESLYQDLQPEARAKCDASQVGVGATLIQP